MRYYSKVILPISSVIFLIAISANAATIPSGRAISLDEIILIAENAGGFLMVLGGVIASIAIIWSGVVYLTAGSDSARVTSAKDTLKAAIIGAFILFSTGLILNTIQLFATDPLRFFR